MSALMPFLALEQTCDQVQAWATQQLTSAGFRVVETFDLQVARMAHPDCLCPHHGTDACNCQMVVLLVYRQDDDPATLLIHGQDGKTWLSLATPPFPHTDHHLEASVRRALVPHRIEVPASTEVAYEARSKD